MFREIRMNIGLGGIDSEDARIYSVTGQFS